MNKKKWIFTIIIMIIGTSIGIIETIKHQNNTFLYLGIGFDVLLILAILWNKVLPDFLNK